MTAPADEAAGPGSELARMRRFAARMLPVQGVLIVLPWVVRDHLGSTVAGILGMSSLIALVPLLPFLMQLTLPIVPQEDTRIEDGHLTGPTPLGGRRAVDLSALTRVSLHTMVEGRAGVAEFVRLTDAHHRTMTVRTKDFHRSPAVAQALDAARATPGIWSARARDWYKVDPAPTRRERWRASRRNAERSTILFGLWTVPVLVDVIALVLANVVVARS